MCQRVRDRQKDRDRERQTEGGRDRERESDRDRQTEGDRESIRISEGVLLVSFLIIINEHFTGQGIAHLTSVFVCHQPRCLAFFGFEILPSNRVLGT